MDPIKQKIIKTALVSRALVWALAVIADALVPNHNAGVFAWSVTPKVDQLTVGDYLVSWLADGLTSWDGQYFLHIANNGYTYENTLAFFPGYPFLVRVAADVIYWLQVDYGLLHFHSALKLAAILVNIGLFTGAAVALYDLSWRLFRDEYLAYKSALFFIVNPASIFFSAAYSESLHAVTSFLLMSCLERGFSFKVGLLLAVSGFSRSNALLNVGFICYKAVKKLHTELVIYRQARQVQRHELSSTLANMIGDAIVPAAFCSMAAIGPFILYQWYGFTLFCGLTKANLGHYDQHVLDYAHDNGLKLPSHEPSGWCSYFLPIAYNYIQRHYWNVGPFQYFHWKQIPNFALASPIIIFVLYRSWLFFEHHRQYCFKMGLSVCDAFNASNIHAYGAQRLPKEAFVYVVHATFLTIFAFCCIHVQVATRMIASSTPVIYWWMAIITIPSDKKPQHKQPEAVKSPRLEVLDQLETIENLQSNWRNLVIDERPKMSKTAVWLLNYFVGYACLGTVMFVNFLPWT